MLDVHPRPPANEISIAQHQKSYQLGHSTALAAASGRVTTVTLGPCYTVELTLPPSKAADMAHLCVPQNLTLGVCRGFVPDSQVCGTHGREDLVNATITSNAEEEEEEENTQ